MEDREKKELAAAIASAMAEATAGSADTARAVAFTKLENRISHLEKALGELEEYKKTNDPVVLWCRTFMDSYRKVLTVVVTSGVLTTIGLLFQLYYMLSKGK